MWFMRQLISFSNMERRMADSFIDDLHGFSDTTGGYWSKDNA